MIDQALQLLKSHNYKVTKQRKALLEYLSQHSDSFLSVTSVDAYMRTLFPGMSHDTIYRNIREFEEIGILEKKNRQGGASVKYQCDFDNFHHHHFICQKCGRVYEVKLDLSQIINDQLSGFEITDHRFELYGICAQCKQQIASK